jgi:hypothetical protein
VTRLKLSLRLLSIIFHVLEIERVLALSARPPLPSATVVSALLRSLPSKNARTPGPYRAFCA